MFAKSIVVFMSTVEALYTSHFGDRKKWPLWRDGRYGEVGHVVWQIHCREYNIGYDAKFLLTVSHNVNPIINNIQRDKLYKNTRIMFSIKMLTGENEQVS